MSKIVTFTLFIFLLVNCNTTKELTNESLSKLQSVSETRTLVTDLSTDEMGGRNVGTTGIEKAAVYIEQYFQNTGVKPYFENSYRHQFSTGSSKTDNVVGIVKGTDKTLQNEYILIGAHYDHLGMIDNSEDSVYNGANDNASGVTGVMQVGAALAKHPPKRSVILALFSAEEKGTVGSSTLAEKLLKQGIDLKCVINLEMLGVTLTDAPQKVYLTGYKKSDMADKLNKMAGETFVQRLETETKYALFYRSDNYPFFKKFSIPSHTLSTFDFTNYKYYHHTEDEVEYLDIENMNAIIQKLSKAVINLANEPVFDIKLND